MNRLTEWKHSYRTEQEAVKQQTFILFKVEINKNIICVYSAARKMILIHKKHL